MSDVVLALTTLPADFDAGQLAQDIVGAGLAACVTIVAGTRSVYMWNGVPQIDQEQQLFIKTTADNVETLWETLRGQHPYDTPEFLVLPVIDGSDEYLRWVGASVGPQPES